MSDKARIDKGMAMFKKVFAGQVPLPKRTAGNTFFLHSITSLMCDIWGRNAMSIRDRRLIILGALAGQGADPALFDIHMRAALVNKELTERDMSEICLTLVPYAGYPRASAAYTVLQKYLAARASVKSPAPRPKSPKHRPRRAADLMSQ
jgi:4-carboxymuconolactone decarboxylase